MLNIAGACINDGTGTVQPDIVIQKLSCTSWHYSYEDKNLLKQEQLPDLQATAEVQLATTA